MTKILHTYAYTRTQIYYYHDNEIIILLSIYLNYCTALIYTQYNFTTLLQSKVIRFNSRSIT